MSKEPILPRIHEQLIREYTITGLVPDWYFRIIEKSAGVWDVEGIDAYGHSISRCSAVNEEEAIRECVEYARRIATGGEGS